MSMSEREANVRVNHIICKYKKCKDVSPRIRRRMNFLYDQFDNRCETGDVSQSGDIKVVSKACSDVVKEIERVFYLI